MLSAKRVKVLPAGRGLRQGGGGAAGKVGNSCSDELKGSSGKGHVEDTTVSIREFMRKSHLTQKLVSPGAARWSDRFSMGPLPVTMA